MKTFFKIVSAILNPLLLPFLGIVLLFQLGSFRFLPLEYKMFIEGAILLNTGFLPALGIWFLRKTGQVSDYDVSVRSERVFPYLIVLLCYLSAIIMLMRYQMPFWVVKLYIGTAFSILVSFFINIRWKISAHTLAFGCLIANIFIICLNQGVDPTWYLIVLLLLSGLQASSRVWLEAHTVGQVLAGFLLGIVSISLAYYFIP